MTSACHDWIAHRVQQVAWAGCLEATCFAFLVTSFVQLDKFPSSLLQSLVQPVDDFVLFAANWESGQAWRPFWFAWGPGSHVSDWNGDAAAPCLTLPALVEDFD
jgi:hypothetical protein